MTPEDTHIADFPGFGKVSKGALAALLHAGIHTLSDMMNAEKAMVITDYSKLPYGDREVVTEALRWREAVLLHYEVEKYMVKNSQRKPIRLFYADLEPAGEDVLRRECPFCLDGVLPLRRDDDGRLEDGDRCIGCGQQVIYQDMAYIRGEEGDT